MKFDELKMEELRNDESYLIDGGLLAGGLAGGILGGTVGLIIATGKGIATGSLSGNELWKCYVSGAMTGGAIGAYTPF
ncbi:MULTISPECIES: hypothetical protein [Helcococcus]|uniref:Bacteriocin n=1 Tax=Helcococcus bovis TaxID=3153252 RepID=A0ABW9F8H7_9FIRM